jgi:hypothetical protein
MSLGETDKVHLTVRPGSRIARVKVICPKITEEQKLQAENNQKIQLCYRIEAIPTYDFEEWANLNNIPFRMEFHDTGIKVLVQKEEHLLWIKLRWT